MKEYNRLLLDKDTRLKVLQNEENQKYSNLVTNPSDTTSPMPKSLEDRSAHVRNLQQFLTKYPRLIREENDGKDLYADNKLVSQGDKNQLSRLLHYMTHDYEPKSSLAKMEYESNIPKGLLEFVTALHRRGYSYENIGNLYLRRHLEKYVRSGRTTTTTTSTPTPTPRPRPTHAATTPRGRSSSITTSKPGSSSSSSLNPARMFSPDTREHKRYTYLQRQIDSGYEKLDKRPMSSEDCTQLMRELSQLVQEKHELVMSAARKMKKASSYRHHPLTSPSSSASSSSSLSSPSPSSMLNRLSTYISDQDTTPVTRQLKRLRPTDTRAQRLDDRKKTKRKFSL